MKKNEPDYREKIANLLVRDDVTSIGTPLFSQTSVMRERLSMPPHETRFAMGEEAPGDSGQPLRDRRRVDISNPMDREQVEDIVARSNAELRTDFATLRGTVDTRFAELGGDVRLLSEAVKNLSSQIAEQAKDVKEESRSRRNTGIATAVGIIAIFATLIAGFGPGFVHHDPAPTAVLSVPAVSVPAGSAIKLLPPPAVNSQSPTE